MSTETILGSMVPFAGTFTIRDFVMCNGEMIQINQFQALFSLLGTTYGGDGRTTFAAPDLRGRSPIGFGPRTGGSNYRLGEIAGNEEAKLSDSNIPSHTHTATFTSTGTAASSLQVATNPANTSSPDEGCYLAAGSSAMYYKPSALSPANLVNIKGQGAPSTEGKVDVGFTGRNIKFSVLSPVLAINWLLSTNGVYPSRS